jgi:formylglycine-generating enzyme required for sulfatase activity
MTSRFGPLSTTRYVANGVPFSMVRVPPGRFLDGAEHLISYPFEIGIEPVSDELWTIVFGNPHRGEPMPLDGASMNNVSRFLARLDVLGLHDFRLPTSAEWAWAVRCGVATRFSGADRVSAVSSRGKFVTPVTRNQPNASGLFGMTGGLLELLSDQVSWGREGGGVDRVGVDGALSPGGVGTRGSSFRKPSGVQNRMSLDRASTFETGLRLCRVVGGP